MNSQILFLRDGRRLGFAEWGMPAGAAVHPVLFFHGSASSRLDRPASEALLARLGIRLITVDRPGHGLSDPQPDRRLLDWPVDVGQLADRLGMPRFHVLGHSAGGPHALVCAHQLPERVINGAVVSSVAPMSRPGAYRSLPLPNRLLALSARHASWITRSFRRIMRRMVMGDVERATRQLMSSIPESDKSILYAPENTEIMVASIREGFRQGADAVALDDKLVNSEWGFDLARIEPRIDIWHGDADVNVPAHAATYLQARIPHTRTTILPGEGHFFLLNRWEEVFSGLVFDARIASFGRTTADRR